MDKHLLLQAAAEIRQLRRVNEILQAKVDTMDLFAMVLVTQPTRQSIGMGEDIAWKLEREHENFTEKKEDASKGD